MRKRVAPSAGPGGPPSAPSRGRSVGGVLFSQRRARLWPRRSGEEDRHPRRGRLPRGRGRLQGQARDPPAVPRFLDAGKAPRRVRGGDRGQPRKRAAHLSRRRGRSPVRARALAIGGAGEVVEWATHMRRFDENATLDKIAERGGLTSRIRAQARACDPPLARTRAHARRREGDAIARDLSRSERSRLRRAARSVRSRASGGAGARGARSARRRPAAARRARRSAATSAAATAICTCATSRSSTASRCCSTRSNSIPTSPPATFSTISPSR